MHSAGFIPDYLCNILFNHKNNSPPGIHAASLSLTIRNIVTTARYSNNPGTTETATAIPAESFLDRKSVV